MTLRASGLTGNPARPAGPSASLWRAGGQRGRPPAGDLAPRRLPSTSPIWYAQKASGRVAVIAGSFWRSDPAAEFRGLTNALVPAASGPLVQAAKSAVGM